MVTAQTVRSLALALPGVVEADHFGGPSFRVAGKIFATLRPDEGRAVLKLPREHQDMLFALRPDAYAPARWGALVWTFVTLAAVDADELGVQLRHAWAGVAPRRLRE
jgi:hypothetical protein